MRAALPAASRPIDNVPAMHTVTGLVKRSPDACWRVLVDPTGYHTWIPALRRARVVDSYDTGLAREVRFELATERTFSRLYSYDLAKQEMSWKPRGDGTSGFARLEAIDGGTKLTYSLEGPSEYDLDKFMASFQSYLHAY